MSDWGVRGAGGSASGRRQGVAMLILLVVGMLAVTHLLDEPPASLETVASGSGVQVVRSAGSGPFEFTPPTEPRGPAPTLPSAETYERLGLPAPLPDPPGPVERPVADMPAASVQGVPGVDEPYVVGPAPSPTVPRTTVAELNQTIAVDVNRIDTTVPPGSTAPPSSTVVSSTVPGSDADEVEVAGATQPRGTSTGGPLPTTGSGRLLRLTAAVGVLLALTGALLWAVSRRRRGLPASGRA